MVLKAADDMEAIRAGLARIEEERKRVLNGGDGQPESLPIEAYEGAINYDDPNAASSSIGVPVAASFYNPVVPPGSESVNAYGQFIVWNGKAWVSRQEWQDKGMQQ